jgi:hypothetical protein
MKVAGFLLLLALLFLGAYAAGARFSPLTTGHSPIEYSGGSTGGSTLDSGGTSGGTGMNGMNMNGSP